ncbi:putative HNH homing endonuclease [Bacillus phage BC01]|nr:putative HNH homing endonuclease [Bacillus phage PBC6]AXU41316.1 putative HNH homing endonuclease [Bacillus phage BC01]
MPNKKYDYDAPLCTVCGTRKCMTSGVNKTTNKVRFKKKCYTCSGHHDRRKKNDPDYTKFNSIQRPYKESIKRKRVTMTCEYCGFKAEDPCQLDIDHIDGNHKNNDPSNHQVLCANCHRLKTKRSKEGYYKDR